MYKNYKYVKYYDLQKYFIDYFYPVINFVRILISVGEKSKVNIIMQKKIKKRKFQLITDTSLTTHNTSEESKIQMTINVCS